jgi:hypothetical protein
MVPCKNGKYLGNWDKAAMFPIFEMVKKICVDHGHGHVTLERSQTSFRTVHAAAIAGPSGYKKGSLDFFLAFAGGLWSEAGHDIRMIRYIF